MSSPFMMSAQTSACPMVAPTSSQLSARSERLPQRQASQARISPSVPSMCPVPARLPAGDCTSSGMKASADRYPVTRIATHNRLTMPR
jgi:hypothetical protein